MSTILPMLQANVHSILLFVNLIIVVLIVVMWPKNLKRELKQAQSLLSKSHQRETELQKKYMGVNAHLVQVCIMQKSDVDALNAIELIVQTRKKPHQPQSAE